MNAYYTRHLEKKIMDLEGQVDTYKNEIDSVRKVLRGLKTTEDESKRKIHELQQRYELARDENRDAKIAYDKRLNTLIRDFVTVYRRLGDGFLAYKRFVSQENELFNTIILKKDQRNERQQFEVDEYRLALRIPRQHYKYIEKLKFEEIMK